MEIFTKLQVSIPFREALKKMLFCEKIMKDFLTGKRKLRDDKKILLSAKCGAIIQHPLFDW